MHVHVVDHPLIAHKLTLLRDRDTKAPTFRALADELVALLAYEATRDVRVEPVTIHTPVAEMTGTRLARPCPLIVPILRAGLGMLEGMLRLLPSAEVGFLGMVRDETTLRPSVYTERMPAEIGERRCFIVDPMLATGGSLCEAIRHLRDRGAGEITAICLLAAPEGVEAVRREFDDTDLTLVLGALDEGLNENAYIVPGLGDAGDRLYGTV